MSAESRIHTRHGAASGHGLTANECAWIDFLRLISQGTDPPPTLRAVQALQQTVRRPAAGPHGRMR